MLTPYAQFDPETGFYLTPEDTPVEANITEEIPNNSQLPMAPDPQIQQLDADSNSGFLDSRAVIMTIFACLVVVVVGVYKFSKRTV